MPRSEEGAGAGRSVTSAGEANGACSQKKYIRDLHTLFFIGEIISLPYEKTGVKIKFSFRQALTLVLISDSNNVRRS